MSSGYFVQTVLVIATLADGTQRYVYGGAEVPDDVPAGEIKRLADEGFIAKVAAGEDKPRDKWTVDEWKAYASAHSIDLGDATKKDDIRAAIEKAEQAPA